MKFRENQGRKKSAHALGFSYRAPPVVPLRNFQSSLGRGAQIFISVSSFCLSGGNAVVSGAGEEGGDKKGLVLSALAQGGLDQGERTEREVPGSKRAQEEPAQCSLTQEAHQRYRLTIFTPSQLRDLERLFQESHYPCLPVR